MKNKIIALIGVVGSGKDYYCSKNQHDKKIGFSDGVREYTWSALGWTPANDFEYESFKTSKILSFIKTVGVQEITGRELMENFATKLREFSNYFWADVWFKKSKEYILNNKGKTLIAHDCRYIEEVQRIFELAEFTNSNVEFIFTNFKSDKYEIREHESESFAQSFLEEEEIEHLTNITDKVKNRIYAKS